MRAGHREPKGGVSVRQRLHQGDAGQVGVERPPEVPRLPVERKGEAELPRVAAKRPRVAHYAAKRHRRRKQLPPVSRGGGGTVGNAFAHL